MKMGDEIEVLECKVRGLENEVRQLRETLRDKYAIAALNGLIAYGWGPDTRVGDMAFIFADLLLEARKK